MDQEAIAHFFSMDPQLRFQKTDLLTQGILKILETTPAGFYSLELQFLSYQVFLQRLENNLILLVLTQSSFEHPTYRPYLAGLCQELQTYSDNAIAQFRLITEDFLAEDSIPTQIQQPSSVPPVPPLPSPAPRPPVPPVFRPDSSPAPRSDQGAKPNLREFLTAFNHLGAIATRYLGNAIIANHLLRTRPNHPWLQQFSIDRQAKIDVLDKLSLLDEPITPEELQLLREWTHQFSAKCSQVIRDFSSLATQQGLPESERSLLLG
ncbi:MAG: hypothetical protein VKJ24_20320 [Synechococcales bacterium]|nr:hypothetical protein [Synechococcales bacterium]